MVDIVPYLEAICARFTQPEMQSSFHGLARTMPFTLQFTFPDLGRTFTLNITEDGNASLTEQTVPRPDVRVTTSSDTLAGILERTINPIQAYMTCKLKVAGEMENLLRLQQLL